MPVLAIEQERLLLAERLLHEIERRHALPHESRPPIDTSIVDRYLAAFLPATHDGLPAPTAVEFAFTPSLTGALDLVRHAVSQVPGGHGSAVYIHDLDVT